MVTTPDMVCARDAQIVARLLEDRQITARLVINRLRPAPVREGKMPDVDEIIDTEMCIRDRSRSFHLSSRRSGRV